LNEEEIGKLILAVAMKVHTALGPGLLENAYETCMAHELGKCELEIKQQVLLPVYYDNQKLDAGYRLDLLLENKVIVELKAVEKILPVHTAQLLSYLKLSKCKLGFILNFNVVHMRDGIKRIVNGL
jgi:GxxExxY protein